MLWTKYHLELALNHGANLQGAYLQGANLQGANLQGAYLQGANLQKAYLQGANLQGAYLQGANLQEANLQEAYLQWAYLQGAYLQGANLQKANLQGAYLQGAYLQWAYLQEANLQEANLQGANLQGTIMSAFSLVPQTGAFEAYKKLSGGVICKILIPAKAKRVSSLVGRKCRAEYVKVLSGNGISAFNSIKYTVGKIVRADSFDDDIRIECTHGIHFFMTEHEAIDYV
jgi:hypothetical protein